MTLRIQRAHPRHLGRTVREVQVLMGLPPIKQLREEFDGYFDVLLGREEPPIDEGTLTLMEVSDAYYARACEVDALIHEAEREGAEFKGGEYYRFRTGYLRSFLECAKRAAELGSRRLTHEQMLLNMNREAWQG